MPPTDVLLMLIPAPLTIGLLALLIHSGRALSIAADIPNDRSLHHRPTPRIGGLVLIPAALGTGVLLMPASRPLLALALMLWLLSFLDDRHSLPVALRLGIHLATAAAAAWLLAPAHAAPWLLMLTLLIAWSANLFNFMDGSDGLAGGMALIGFAAYGLAAWPEAPALATLCGTLAAATAGFLVFNFPPARCFMGDAGSVPLGFLAATLGCWGMVENLWPAWFPALVFLPFLADATITLLRRIVTGQRFWQAHREHYYQRLIRMGWSHRRLALRAYGLMALCGAIALMLRAAPALAPPVLAASLVALALLLISIDRRWRNQGESCP